jgi:hypothetical protein
MRGFPGLLALALALPFAAAAPVPPDRRPLTDLFPTAVGTKWVYDHDGTEHVFVITAAERKGGETVVTTGLVGADGEAVEYEVLAISPGGVSCLGGRGRWDYVRSPHCAGASWESKHVSAGGGEVVRTHTAREPEEVTVPAGKFWAVRVDAVDDYGQEKVRWSHWYMAGVGLIKVTYEDRQRRCVMALKAFTPGKP